MKANMWIIFKIGSKVCSCGGKSDTSKGNYFEK